MLLCIFHGLLDPLPLHQPGHVIVTVPGLSHHNVGRSYNKKKRFSFDVTELMQEEQ
jgi:hypothetical protein